MASEKVKDCCGGSCGEKKEANWFYGTLLALLALVMIVVFSLVSYEPFETAKDTANIICRKKGYVGAQTLAGPPFFWICLAKDGTFHDLPEMNERQWSWWYKGE